MIFKLIVFFKFLFTCLNYWEKCWNSNYNFGHIFFHLFKVILYVIGDIHIYNNSLLWIYHFGIIWFLYLVIFPVLNSVFSFIIIATPAFLWLCVVTIFHSFTLKLSVFFFIYKLYCLLTTLKLNRFLFHQI